MCNFIKQKLFAAEQIRILGIVGHEQDRPAIKLVQNEIRRLSLRLSIESVERLVKKQKVKFGKHCAEYCRAASHTAAELGRRLVDAVAESERVCRRSYVGSFSVG